MTGRNASPRHYPARRRTAPSAGARLHAPAFGGLLAVAMLLGGCASAPDPVDDGLSPSEPLPLRSARTSAPKPLDVRAEDLLMNAMTLIGTPYRFGGTTPDRGFDCSGFTSYVFRETAGVTLPRTANDQYLQSGIPVERDALASGDLVFFRQRGKRIDHVGIYVGDGRFIHSPSRGGRVRIDALSNPHWTRTFHGARRLLAAAP